MKQRVVVYDDRIHAKVQSSLKERAEEQLRANNYDMSKLIREVLEKVVAGEYDYRNKVRS